MSPDTPYTRAHSASTWSSSRTTDLGRLSPFSPCFCSCRASRSRKVTFTTSPGWRLNSPPGRASQLLLPVPSSLPKGTRSSSSPAFSGGSSHHSLSSRRRTSSTRSTRHTVTPPAKATPCLATILWSSGSYRVALYIKARPYPAAAKQRKNSVHSPRLLPMALPSFPSRPRLVPPVRPFSPHDTPGLP